MVVIPVTTFINVLIDISSIIKITIKNHADTFHVDVHDVSDDDAFAEYVHDELTHDDTLCGAPIVRVAAKADERPHVRPGDTLNKLTSNHIPIQHLSLIHI